MSVVVPIPPDPPSDARPGGVSLRRTLRYLAAMATLCAVAAFPASAVFGLRSVAVAGNVAVPESDVLRRAGLGPGLGAFRVNAWSIRQRLLEDPRIEDSAVAMIFPWQVTVLIRERPPVAALSVQHGYVLVGRDAVVIREALDPEGLPTLIVDRFDPAVVAVGTLLGAPDVRLGAWVAGELPESLKHSVRVVRVDGAGEASLGLRDGVSVRLGGAQGIADRLGMVPDVLSGITARGLRVEYVDVRFTGSVIVRPVRAAGAPPITGGRQENPPVRGIDPAMHRPSPP
jgi:cell division septal protein FtsQ